MPKEMDFKDGWLQAQLERAAKEVELWPLHQQESMTGKTFTPFERYKASKTRVQRLYEEIEREKAAMDAYLLDLLRD